MYKKVNIKYTEKSRMELWRGKVFGPFYYMNSVEDTIEYFEQVESKKFASAFEHLLTTSLNEKIPADRLDHYLDQNRNDYGHQRVIHFAAISQQKGLLIGSCEMSQRKLSGLLKLVVNYGAVLVNENGGYQSFDEEEMEIVDEDVTTSSKNDVIAVDIAVLNLKNYANTLILENSFELPKSFYEKIYKKLGNKNSYIYNFKNADKLQLKRIFDHIQEQIHTIAFQTEFVNKKQIMQVIGLLCKIQKPLTFHILSSKDPNEVIDQFATEEQKEILKKHKIISYQY